MAAQLAPLTNRYEQTEIVNVIRQTVAKGASDAQLRMFLEVCRSTGLDPFLKEIYYVAEKSIIMASRDGYLRVANQHPQFDGMETRVERDERNIPVKATCSEYKKPGPVWSQYPSAMISKVAEVLALKRSFAINGVVTEEEMGTEPRGSVAAAQEVAQAKIAAMTRGPQPVAALIEQAQEAEYVYEDAPDDEQPTVEEQLQYSLDAERIKRLDAFAELKRRYAAISFTRTSYAMLGQFGARHASEFPETPEGLDEARACYAAMKLDLQKREARGR